MYNVYFKNPRTHYKYERVASFSYLSALALNVIFCCYATYRVVDSDSRKVVISASPAGKRISSFFKDYLDSHITFLSQVSNLEEDYLCDFFSQFKVL